MTSIVEHPQRHRVDVQEYLRMGQAGVFGPDARLELIEGEIIEMAPIGSRHSGAVISLNRIFGEVAGKRALVSVQNPLIAGPRSMPQPDVALLKPRSDAYSSSHPIADDVLLLVEVSDTTLEFDIGTKIPLYARAGIIEAWVVDVHQQTVHVFREPSAEGYRTSYAAKGSQKLTMVALPRLSIPVPELFPA